VQVRRTKAKRIGQTLFRGMPPRKKVRRRRPSGSLFTSQSKSEPAFNLKHRISSKFTTPDFNWRQGIDSFPSSVGQPVEFPLDRLFPAGRKASGKWKSGGKAKLVCPSDIAYGDPGKTTVYSRWCEHWFFEVELLDVKHLPQRPLLQKKTSTPKQNQSNSLSKIPSL